MTPSEELRAASVRVREVGTPLPEGPWSNDSDVVRGAQGECVVDVWNGYAMPTLADYVALFDPTVAELLAQVLEQQAEEWEDMGEPLQRFVATPNGDDPETASPLYLLARAINGSEDTGGAQ